MANEMTEKQFQCSHTSGSSDRWVDGHYDDWGDWKEGEWEYDVVDNRTFEDISNSQYQCTQCKLTFNYTGGNSHHVYKGERVYV